MSAPKPCRCIREANDAGTHDAGCPAAPKPAPSAEPELPDGWEMLPNQHGDPIWRRGGNGYRYVTLEVMRALLSRAGLAIVPAADVPSAEERVWRHDRELNARRAETFEALLREAVDDLQGLPSWRERAKAELARRAAKETKTDG